MTAEEYREKVLKTILEYESHFNAVDDYEVKDAIAYLYEIIRGIDAIPSAERISDIDLSTKEEVEFRFSQLCACFAMLVRDKTEPQNVYLELFYVANALKEKYC